MQIPRIVELWREAKELEDRRLLCSRDGNVNEMTMLSRFPTTSGDSNRPDTSGSNAYNQKLSECRSDAVKTNLVGKGIGEGTISTSGKGEAELMVQTGDGVKEPQNRRATVDLN